LYEEESYPKTEVICSDLSKVWLIAIAGPLLPVLLAVLLFFLGGTLLREVALLMVGFNLISSSRDLAELGFGNNLIFASLFVGVVFLFFGLIYLAKYRLFEDEFRELRLK
jgi:hypothetical protein